MLVLEQLRTQRQSVAAQLQQAVKPAADENRFLTSAEQANYDRLTGELEQLDQRIAELGDQAQRSQDADDAFRRIQGDAPWRRPQNRELRAWARGDQGTPRAFEVGPDNPIDYRTLSKLTAGAGLNTVPTSFYERLMAHLIETAGIMQAGPTVFNTASGEALQVPKTTTHSTAAVITEAGPIGASDPAFGQTTLGAFKYGVFVQVSRELVDDTGVDLEGYLAMETGRALGNAFGAHCITGTGTGQPRGVSIDSTLGVTGGAGAAPTADQLISLFHSVIPPYRNSPSCAWMMRDATWQAARSLKDTTNQYLIGPLATGVDMQLLGKPVIIDPTVPAVATAAKSVLFGDFRAYFVRLAGSIRFERSDDFAFQNHLVSYRALLRADGALIDLTGAIKHYVSA